MDEKIKLNYPAMMEMAAHCQKAAQRLQDTTKMGTGIASQMEGGALVGATGQLFCSALREGLTPSVNKLADKLNEIARDISAAVSDMQAQDGSAGQRFSGR
jgi:WXG100 family type VII secretion target